MDYYRSGCFLGERDVPGNMMLIALMSEMTTPAGTPPSQLVLLEGHMQAGIMSAPCRQACELLVYLVTGAMLARVGEEEARLIAGDSLRIHAATEYQFSTTSTRGMTAVVIIPRQEDPSLSLTHFRNAKRSAIQSATSGTVNNGRGRQWCGPDAGYPTTTSVRAERCPCHVDHADRSDRGGHDGYKLPPNG